MSENIIPLIYVLALGSVAYTLCNGILPDEERLGFRHIAFFLILNVTGFLITYLLPAPYAVFLVTSIISLIVLTPVEPVQRIAMFFFLCPLLPSLDWDLHIGIPFMWMTWPRLVTIVILLPLLAGALRRRPMFDSPIDKYVWAFFLLNAILAFRDTSFTNGLRGVTYLTIDFFAPYLILSRYLNSFADIRKVLFALLAVLIFAGMVNVFETVRTWHIYEQLILNINGARLLSIERIGLLRATGAFGIPSRAGFALATALGLVWALSPHLRNRKLIFAVVAILSGGLLVTFSRGNWAAGAIIGLFYLFMTSRKQFVQLAAILALIFGTLSYFNLADELINVLPFIGDEESEAARTVSYRQELLDTSIRVASENPWFGSTTFHEHPDMDAIRQDTGLLDLVNHYIIVLLNTGYTGLALFVMVLLSTFSAFFRAVRNAAQAPADQRIFCTVMMLSFFGLLVAITTTSALGRVGLIIWSFIAVAAAADRILQPESSAARSRKEAGMYDSTGSPSRGLLNVALSPNSQSEPQTPDQHLEQQ
jgi:hypothetical protein